MRGSEGNEARTGGGGGGWCGGAAVGQKVRGGQCHL
jgi:hypothetical protein